MAITKETRHAAEDVERGVGKGTLHSLSAVTIEISIEVHGKTKNITTTSSFYTTPGHISE
jgi:hypothetical protein